MPRRVTVPIVRTGRSTGRPPRYAGPYKTIATQLPWIEWEVAESLMEDPEVITALAFLAERNVNTSEYIRAAVILFTHLLDGPTRDRVLAMGAEIDRAYVEENDPEIAYARISKIASHLEYRWAKEFEPDHVLMHKQATDVEPQAPGLAPVSERDPWNNF